MQGDLKNLMLISIMILILSSISIIEFKINNGYYINYYGNVLGGSVFFNLCIVKR